MMQPGSTALPASAPTVADAVRDSVRLRVGPRAWQECFQQRTQLAVRSEGLVVTVANTFLQQWLQRQFRIELLAAAREHLGPQAQLHFAVDSTAVRDLAADTQSATALTVSRANAGLSLVPRDDVIPHDGESVELARDADSGEVRQSLSIRPVLRTTSQQSDAGQTVRNPSSSSRGESSRAEGIHRRRFSDLSDFVPGPGSQLALTAIQRMTQHLGAVVNPLVIYGPVGNGKTHLLEGIYRQIRRQSPSLSVMYLTAETFTNFFTENLRDHTLPAFRQKFRTVQVLIVDDIDFLDGKKGVQEEFLHTFKQLHGQGRQIVIAAGRHPRLYSRLSDELMTRLLSGMVCRLELPDLPTRQAIAARKAAAMGAAFDSRVINYVAERFPRSVRELEGALHCLQTWQTMAGNPVSLTQARQVLADLERDCVRPVSLADIERVVCQAFGLQPADLRSARRTKALTQPRMVAMYLARKHTPAAYKEIGEFFGGRNHSTVISAERKIDGEITGESTIRVASQSLRLAELVGSLEQQLLVG